MRVVEKRGGRSAESVCEEVGNIDPPICNLDIESLQEGIGRRKLDTKRSVRGFFRLKRRRQSIGGADSDNRNAGKGDPPRKPQGGRAGRVKNGRRASRRRRSADCGAGGRVVSRVSAQNIGKMDR